MNWLRGTEEYVDVEDHARRILIREAEYQQSVEATSKVLRVSGKVTAPARCLQAVVQRERTK